MSDSGSIFVQIGDENVHRVRALMDEVFGDTNSVALIPFIKTTGKGGATLDNINDYLVWYAKDIDRLKYRQLYNPRSDKTLEQAYNWLSSPTGKRIRLNSNQLTSNEDIPDGKRFYASSIISASGGPTTKMDVILHGKTFQPPANSYWKTNARGMERLTKADRLHGIRNTLTYVRFSEDFPIVQLTNWWGDTKESTFAIDRLYVVQTYTKVIERCILMATDPGDLVLDPTCGSGTTAYVAEQWGRRWITIDTSRVALALARARIMGARYPYFLLKDSRDGQLKEAELSRTIPSSEPTFGNIRQGFVYERVPHIMLKTIANNAEIDVI